MEKQIYQYLSGMPHFSFLPKEEREKIAAAAAEKSFPKGTTYAFQGQSKIDSIFIVKKGSIALFDEKKGAKNRPGSSNRVRFSAGLRSCSMREFP